MLTLLVFSIMYKFLSRCQIGLINTSLIALNAMSKSNGGHGGIIVNIASVTGLVTLPGIPFYNASKHGVIGFTRTMAVSSPLSANATDKIYKKKI